MAYDEELAERIRGVTSGSMRNGCSGVSKYLLNDNMACGVHKEALIVRVGPQHYEEELSKPGKTHSVTTNCS